MPLIFGGNAGCLAPIIQAIVPIGQFALSSTILGSNNFQSGQTSNRQYAGQPRDVVLAYLTAQVYGALAMGTVTLTVPGTSVSWALNAGNLTINGNNAAGVYNIFASQFVKINKGTSISLSGTSSGYMQLSGGLIVSLWAWGTNT